jgi:two-component system, cell cycle sensor histidine kinase and response regulator CckA
VLEFVIEAMADAVMVIDAEGKIILANAGATHLSGYSPEALRGMPIAKLLSDDASGLRTIVRRRIEDGAILRREESYLTTISGERIPVGVTASPVMDDKDLLHGIVLVARDMREIREEIARRRVAEEELRRANASIEDKLRETRQQLLLAERRATLGTLAGGVGHELRNIAQIQVAAVDELAAAIRAKEDVTVLARQILPDLERVGDHITAHGNRLMQLAHPGSDQAEELELTAIINDVVSMLQLAGRLGHVALDVDLGSSEVYVTANRTRVEQVLVNLILNAVDAMAGSGTVVIKASKNPMGRIACSIADTGPGIPDALKDKIFEPFFTTKGEKGTGLGLPVVKEIVTSYGGQLKFTTGPRGTTFTFDLPA